MPCSNPNRAWVSRVLRPNGRLNLDFCTRQPCRSGEFLFQDLPKVVDRRKQVREGFVQNAFLAGKFDEHDRSFPIEIPCRKCEWCIQNHARLDGIRLAHEAMMHEDKCFLTTTYAPEHLKSRSLVFSDFSAMVKRWRAERDREGLGPIKVYFCGEYGSRFGRPHFHAIVFGARFDDLTPHVDGHTRHSKYPLMDSPHLHDLWGKGRVAVGDVTFESAAYCTRYATKKHDWSGRTIFHRDTGEILKPEKAVFPHSYSVGSSWLEKYWTDIYWNDVMIFNGFPSRPPRAYDKWMEKHKPDIFRDILKVRARHFLDSPAVPEQVDRLQTIEQVQCVRYQQLVRGYEDEVLAV